MRISYNLIDSGQHASLTPVLRKELGVREPDIRLRVGEDLETIPSVTIWLGRFLIKALFRPHAVCAQLFRGDRGGVCVIHGDTPSTFLSAFLARRAGLKVAHLEAGLRSFNYLNPFPEELIRVIVMRWADLLFAPSNWAAENLARMNHHGTVLNVRANTNVEELRYSMDAKTGFDLPVEPPYVLATIHRVETLYSRKRLRQVVALIIAQSQHLRVLFILHPPTEAVLRKSGLYACLESMQNIKLTSLLPHAVFLRCVQAADFVITDGGSVQEECAMLGKPCLLMRRRTERLDGIGRNVVLSEFDEALISDFLLRWKELSEPPAWDDLSPSEMIAEQLRPFAGPIAAPQRPGELRPPQSVAEVRR